MNPFFIGSLPPTADYADNRTFFDGDERNDLLNRVQIIDPAWSETEFERIRISQPNPRFAKQFEIKDMQLSAVDREILCSICLFRRNLNFEDPVFSYYLNHLKEKIEVFTRSCHAKQKLRVYVGNDIWDLLHKEKVLKAKHVDFVRMSQSSRYSQIGMQWRILAYDDYAYQCVYMDDTDWHDNLEIMDDDEFDRRFPVEVRDKFHFSLTSFTPFQDHSADLWDFHSFHRDVYWDIFYIRNPLNYFLFHDLAIIRGSRRVPFEVIVPFLVEPWTKRGKLYTLFDPARDIWTDVGELVVRHEWVNYLGFWLFYLRKQLALRYWYLIDYYELLNTLDENHFLKRLHHQIFEKEGNKSL